VLDRVRRRVNEARFALGAQLILAISDPLEVARGYARVAEAAIQVLADETVRAFEAALGRVPDSELLILGLGRLGGRALTHASDLDLIYLFSGTHEAMPPGQGWPRRIPGRFFSRRHEVEVRAIDLVGWRVLPAPHQLRVEALVAGVADLANLLNRWVDELVRVGGGDVGPLLVVLDRVDRLGSGVRLPTRHGCSSRPCHRNRADRGHR
jgi:hypothetical protein